MQNSQVDLREPTVSGDGGSAKMLAVSIVGIKEQP
jgi:hypothetical protein